jgi:hypothetical protein
MFIGLSGRSKHRTLGDENSMNIIRILILLSLAWLTALHAQETCMPMPFIRGLTVHAGEDEGNLPIVLTAASAGTIDSTQYGSLTIRFDVDERVPPRLAIRFRHCDRDWRVDTDGFVRDDFFTYTRSLYYEQAPAGVHGYAWRFINRFPSREHPFVRFLYSGNWLFEVTDERDEDAVYATGRFVVVENVVPSALEVQNDYWTDNAPPHDMVHRLRLRMRIPELLFADFVTTVDFYRDRRLYHPMRVSAYDFSRNTRVEGLGTREKSFTYLNAQPGNGYRYMDITSPGNYPSGHPVRLLRGPDFTRFRFGTDLSRFDGASRTGGWSSDAEYMCVRFELAHPLLEERDVFVAGNWNFWDPQESDRMQRDAVSGNYVLDRWLLRGEYDYQYVTGTYEPERGYVVDSDWTQIEGNDWAARNLYWAIIYYDDDQHGGITRAVGAVISRSR